MDRPARGLVVTVVAMGNDDPGSVVDVWLDGTYLGSSSATGTGELRFEVDVQAGLHVLRLVRVFGRRMVPGEVRLAGSG